MLETGSWQKGFHWPLFSKSFISSYSAKNCEIAHPLLINLWKVKMWFKTFQWSGFIRLFIAVFWSYWIFFLALNKWPSEIYQVCNLKPMSIFFLSETSAPLFCSVGTVTPTWKFKHFKFQDNLWSLFTRKSISQKLNILDNYFWNYTV